ncbi:sulfatase [Capnocytophaga sp.]|uniref:sulfatase n=1 Tax=Capnocytophaga sp. TaxID=44737 RepID=UPI0026DB0C54|nr:sulfatase [Capnocytophaga sp.]MDO5104373.1 sulfatase [Capnocytophaga sp.]
MISALMGLSITDCRTISAEVKNTPENRPNIILFVVDDMGWQDTSVAFHSEKTELNQTYHTPHMERLAKQGMKFTQAYAAPICSPSRVSLMTGTNPARHRVTNWTLEYNKQTDHTNEQLSAPNWNCNGLANQPDIPNSFQATALPELLKQGGYHTIHIGKAHFAAQGTPCADPLNMGFNVNVSGHAGGGLQSYEGKDNFGNIPQKTGRFAVPMLEEFHGRDIFLTEALTQKALRELDKRPKNKPFFLYMSHYAVHVPIMGDARFLQKYLDKGMNPIEAQYATLLEGMDKSLGDILNYLDNNKLNNNTLVVFLSDNGGLDAIGRGRKPNTCNAPLASGKGTLREGGIRIPFLAWWQGKIKAGSVSDKPINIEDIFPTLAEIASVGNKKIIQTIDGESLLPILLTTENLQKNTERPLFWHLPNQWYDTDKKLGIAPSSAIRKGNYKLLYYHDTQQILLYDLATDLGETRDISAENPQKTRQLAKILSDYLRSVDAQMPIIKKTGKPVPFPDEIL